MNLILLSPNDFIDKKAHVRLNDRRYLHIRDVHRAKAGDELSVGLIGDRIGTGKITSLTGEAIEMDISMASPVREVIFPVPMRSPISPTESSSPALARWTSRIWR